MRSDDILASVAVICIMLPVLMAGARCTEPPTDAQVKARELCMRNILEKHPNHPNIRDLTYKCSRL